MEMFARDLPPPEIARCPRRSGMRRDIGQPLAADR